MSQYFCLPDAPMKPMEEAPFEFDLKPARKKPSSKPNSSSTLASDLAEPQADITDTL